MKLQKLLVSSCLLILPMTSFAMPSYQMTVGNYSGNGFAGSVLHKADRCYNSGYYMCGSEAYRGLSGVLDMKWDQSTSSYTGINGDLIGGGKTVNILGGTLYTQLTNGSWGSLYTNYGIFTFDDLSPFYSGAANNYKDDAYYLWGQTGSALSLLSKQDEVAERWGLDLYGEVTAVPEPATLSLMTLGLLGLGAAARKKKLT